MATLKRAGPPSRSIPSRRRYAELTKPNNRRARNGGLGPNAGRSGTRTRRRTTRNAIVRPTPCESCARPRRTRVSPCRSSSVSRYPRGSSSKSTGCGKTEMKPPSPSKPATVRQPPVRGTGWRLSPMWSRPSSLPWVFHQTSVRSAVDEPSLSTRRCGERTKFL